MNIDEYLEMIETDSTISKNDLTTEALRIPILIAKYQRHFMIESRILKQSEALLDRKRLETFRYYTGDAPDEVYRTKPLNKKPIKSEVEKYYIDGDKDFQEIDQKVHTQKLKVRMIEDQLKALTQRTFIIKNAIDAEKLKLGVV